MGPAVLGKGISSILGGTVNILRAYLERQPVSEHESYAFPDYPWSVKFGIELRQTSQCPAVPRAHVSDGEFAFDSEFVPKKLLLRIVFLKNCKDAIKV